MLRFLTAGESHGPCLTVIVEGMPAGWPINLGEVNRHLRRRQGGYGRGGRMKIEQDEARVTSGIRWGETLGSPITLVVEPAMQGQGKVVLRIKAKSSTLGPPSPPDDIPEELSRMVDAEVVVGDGETAVLGGLLREARSRSGSGVPVLRSIPLVGLLFGKQLDEDEGEELIVLVTPRLLG